MKVIIKSGEQHCHLHGDIPGIRCTSSRLRFLFNAYLIFIIGLLWVLTTSVIVAGWGIITASFPGDPQIKLSLAAFCQGFKTWGFRTAGFALTIVALAGLFRWMMEVCLNLKLAISDKLEPDVLSLLSSRPCKNATRQTA